MVMMRLVLRRSRKRFIAQWTTTGDLNGQVEEAFTGHAVLKAFDRQGEAEERFVPANDELFEASFRAQFMAGLLQPGMMLLGNLNYVVIAVVGGLRVAAGAISIGDIQAFIQYSRQFTQPLTMIGGQMNLFQSGLASAERVFALLDAEEQSPDPYPAVELPTVSAGVEFRARLFLLRPGQAFDPGPVADRRARPDGRHRRPDRGGQDHPGQPHHAVLRDRLRVDQHRRGRHPDHDPGGPAIEAGHGAAGHLAVRRHHPRQHRLRAGRRHRGGDHGGRPDGPRGPLRPHPSRRL